MILILRLRACEWMKEFGDCLAKISWSIITCQWRSLVCVPRDSNSTTRSRSEPSLTGLGLRPPSLFHYYPFSLRSSRPCSPLPYLHRAVAAAFLLLNGEAASGASARLALPCLASPQLESESTRLYSIWLASFRLTRLVSSHLVSSFLALPCFASPCLALELASDPRIITRALARSRIGSRRLMFKLESALRHWWSRIRNSCYIEYRCFENSRKNKEINVGFFLMLCIN